MTNTTAKKLWTIGNDLGHGYAGAPVSRRERAAGPQRRVTDPKRPARSRSGPSGKNKHKVVTLRPSREGQAEEWREAAARLGMTLAAWMREACDEAAREK